MGLPNSDQILNQVFDSDDNTLQVDVKSAVTGGEPQAMGSDATGADTYATILTASADRQHKRGERLKGVESWRME